MCSLDRSSEPWHWLSLWSRRVRLSFLLCHEKEAASAVRGQGGYTHHHPGWPAVGPGGHTCPGHSQSQCAARCSCKRHTGWPVVATACSPSHSCCPLSLLRSPISHRDQLPQPPARTPILSHSLQAAYAVTRMTFLKLRNRYGSSLRDKAMSKLLHWGARRLLPPPNPPSQSHTSLLRTSPFPLHWGIYLCTNKAHIHAPVFLPELLPLPGILICFLIILTTVYWAFTVCSVHSICIYHWILKLIIWKSYYHYRSSQITRIQHRELSDMRQVTHLIMNSRERIWIQA